jgi:hypothetical protein
MAQGKLISNRAIVFDDLTHEAGVSSALTFSATEQ